MTPNPENGRAIPDTGTQAGFGEAVAVSDLSFAYGPDVIFDGLSFTLEAGTSLAVIGPSGCGKSTLLYLLAGLARPAGGSVTLRGRDGDRPRVSLILQDYGLFPWKTVAENIGLPLEIGQVPCSIRQGAVQRMLAELKLAGFGDRYPGSLSGGQRQRVAIGRALITEPDLLLMDEPFSSLDAITREHLQQFVLSLWQRRRTTTVLVTHNVEEAAFLGRNVLVLGGSPARERLWQDNSGYGDPRYPQSEAFFAVTRRIHRALRADGASPC